MRTDGWMDDGDRLLLEIIMVVMMWMSCNDNDGKACLLNSLNGLFVIFRHCCCCWFTND